MLRDGVSGAFGCRECGASYEQPTDGGVVAEH